MGALQDFKDFINKGNIIQLAVAFIIGTAFSAVVSALVTDIITPVIAIPGKLDFAAWVTTVNGSIIYQGLFLNALIYFIIVALVVFFGIVRPLARMQARADAKKAAAPPTDKECPYCLGKVPIKATKCMFCTSAL